MKNVIITVVSVFLLISCEPKPEEGRYYTQNNMLEINLLSRERFAFQILSTTSRKPKYVSGKAIYIGDWQYYYQDEKQQLFFKFEDNYAKITQIDSDKGSSYKHFEGTYLHLNPANLYEPVSNVVRTKFESK